MDEQWIKFVADTATYPEMLDFVVNAAKAEGISDKKLLKLQLGFEEAVVNVIHYAYAGQAAPGFIWLGIACKAGTFVIKVADQGVPFNPLEREDPLAGNVSQPENLMDAKIGGLGISFIKRTFNQVMYQYEAGREKGRNVLTLSMTL